MISIATRYYKVGTDIYYQFTDNSLPHMKRFELMNEVAEGFKYLPDGSNVVFLSYMDECWIRLQRLIRDKTISRDEVELIAVNDEGIACHISLNEDGDLKEIFPGGYWDGRYKQLFY